MMNNAMRGKVVVVLVACCVCALVAAPPAAGQETEVMESELSFDDMVIEDAPVTAPGRAPQAAASSDLSFDEQQITQINKSLKNSIDENRRILQERSTIENELKKLRGESQIRINRINTLSRQRDDLEARLTELDAQQAEYMAQLEEMKKTLEAKEQEFEQKLQDMKDQQEQKRIEDQETLATLMPGIGDRAATAETRKQLQDYKRQAQEALLNVQQSANQAARQMQELSQENKKLQEDTARMHYNMGNTFFEQGKYKRAAQEYAKVVEITPYDAAAHYNLAFVTGDFLGDYKTALEHYERYLYLHPDAEDEFFVREKIMQAQLILKTRIDSPIDK